MPKTKKLKKPGRQKTAIELTEAEWEIMKVLWEKQPCAAGTIQETLTDTRNWAYSTVKTTMDRMVEKGLLKTEKIRNLQLFRPNISEDDAKKGEFRKMLQRAFDGAIAPMMQFLVDQEEFSKEELKHLRQLADKAQRRRG